MATEYRHMVPSDEQGMLGLWMDTWPGANRERATQRIHSDPRYLEHSFAAISDNGEVLATAHYWLRQIRDAEGNPRTVGCLSHVATCETARRQGHARALVHLAHDAMRADGCEYALLFSSNMGVPMYEGMGYVHIHAPYWQGLISREKPAGGEGFAVHEFVPDTDEAIKVLANIYDAYNATRPASLIRSVDYWQNFIANNVGEGGWAAHRSFVLVAAPEGENICGYVMLHTSDEEMARREFNLDQVFTISEIGVVPGQEAAIPALLSGVVDRLRPGNVGGQAFVPREPHIEQAIKSIFTDSLHEVDDRNIMALPLPPSITREDIQSIWSAPGAYFWQPDDF